MHHQIIVVGAGVFGVTAALELRRRGHSVRLIAPGPIPHPLAASTDISKVVRMEYGTDDQYLAMAAASMDGFRRWNSWMGEKLYHETGLTALTIEPIEAEGFEYECFRSLQRHGYSPERLSAPSIAERFPAWNAERYVDGFFNAHAGWVESGRLLAALTAEAAAQGVVVQEGEVVTVNPGHVRTRDGRSLRCDLVIVAAGAWTPLLVPDLKPYVRTTGHPVFHLRPSQPELFAPPNFHTFMGDVARTGWYGFPLHPREGVVKIGNHGVGLPLHPVDDPREIAPEEIGAMRDFLHVALPALQYDPVVYTRRCLYLDTLDEHFWIDFHPDSRQLFVATGGSGHAMKFAPVLGSLIADAIEGLPNDWLDRFRWRTLSTSTKGEEAARFHG